MRKRFQTINDVFKQFRETLSGLFLLVGLINPIDENVIKNAKSNLQNLSYTQYSDQVGEYLDIEDKNTFNNKEYWNLICETILHILENTKK